jgi:NTP pyrophosphatase (non-canonical NTP hydrolase)
MLSFDFETFLFGPGDRAPQAVCVTWARPAGILHAKDAEPTIAKWLASDELLVGQNVAYDTTVICANWPHLTHSVFAKYERDQILCTKIREQLIDTAMGRFRGEFGEDGEWVQKGYGLDDLSARYRGRRLEKDGWRMFYSEFADVPLSEWVTRAQYVQAKYKTEFEALRQDPDHDKKRFRDLEAMIFSVPEKVLSYPIEDAVATLEVFEAQEGCPEFLTDQFRQTRYQFALALTSCWGLRTDPEKVEAFARAAEEDFHDLKQELVGAGLVRPDKVTKKGKVTPGAADTSKAKEAMLKACADAGLEPILTKGGATSLGAEACARVDDPLIQAYSEFQTARKVLSNDVEMLRDALQICHPQYDLAATGRTTCANPNIQALRKKAGIRDCFVPDEGNVFIQCDYPSLELFTRAEWCIRVLGSSALGVTLNEGKDAHLQVAAVMLEIPYEEALARKSEDLIKNARQAAKAINFGLPGGLGIAKLVKYAKSTYKVDLTEEQAKEYKKDWMRVQPEVKSYFDLAGDLCNNEAGLGGETSPFTGQVTSKKRYSELCNERFQRLGADIAKLAMWNVVKACYDEPSGPLYGFHPVAFVHDEIICEGPSERAATAAAELARLMKVAANIYLTHVPMHDEKTWPLRLEPCIMTCWSKEAKPTYNDEGELIAWEPK